MNKGDKVLVTNKDSSFYGEKGRIVGVNNPFFTVFIFRRDKGTYNFTRFDLELLNEEGE